MAAYTSTQSGDWTNTATWGGGGYPSVAGDTAVISAGHTVTYNVSTTTEMGQITVNGILKFSEGMSTLLALGSFDIDVANGGELRVGNEASPIGSSYTAKITFNPASDGLRGVDVASGGKLTICGTDVVGGVYWTPLMADWTSGQTFTVQGDVTGKWATGQKVWVHKFPASYAANGSSEYTIQSMALNGGNTDVTISEAAPGVTFKRPGLVLNLTRNVTIEKVGATRTIGSLNTSRAFVRSATATANNTSVKFCEFVGLYQPYFTGYADMEGVVIRNGFCFGGAGASASYATLKNMVLFSVESGFTQWNMATIDGFVIAHTTNTTTGNFRNCNRSTFKNGHVYGAQGVTYGLYGANACVFDNVCHYDNARNIIFDNSASANRFINCFFNCSSYYSSVACASTADAQLSSTSLSDNTLDNCFFAGSADITLNNWNPVTATYGQSLISRNHNGVAGDVRFYTHYLKAYSDSTTRAGGAAFSIKLTLGSNTQEYYSIPIMELIESNVPAGFKSRAVYVRGGGWSSYPTASELYLEAVYCNDVSSLSRAVKKSTAVLTDNTTWVALSVSFYHARNGDLEYRLVFSKYAASTNVYVDAMLVVEGES